MVIYRVTLHPAPGAIQQELDNLLTRIQSLAGVLPGLSRVAIQPASDAPNQPCGYIMYFDTDAHMQAYTAHPAYQAIRGELHRLSPKTTVSSISTTLIHLTIDLGDIEDTDDANGRP